MLTALLITIILRVGFIQAKSCDPSRRPPLPETAKDMLTRTVRLDGVPSDEDIKNAVNCQRVQRLVNESAFAYLFPLANEGKGVGKGPYSYQNFLKAVAKWPKFCDDVGSEDMTKDEVCLRELATMFAHFVQEVGAHDPSSQYPSWRQGLYYFNEINPGWNYCATSPQWVKDRFPCSSNQSYFGRGAKQVSYNYNYGPFSVVIFDNASVLLADPGKVIDDGWLAFASAIWFDMTPQTPKPSVHDVVTGWWKPNQADKDARRLPGFGATIMITNGGIECGHSSEQANNRIKYYKVFCEYFGISPGPEDSTKCDKMTAFDTSSSAATEEYWEWADWLNNCRLVTYQSAYSIFENSHPDVPYCRCFEKYAP